MLDKKDVRKVGSARQAHKKGELEEEQTSVPF